MKPSNFRHVRRLALAFGSAAILMGLASGCIYIHESSSSSRNDADLQAVANRARTGEIPSGIKSLEIENQFGAIRVVATEHEPALWSWKLVVQAKTDSSAQGWADASSCTATQDGGTLRLAVSLPNTSGARSIQSDLEIRVPKSVSLRTRTRFGETVISGIDGAIEVSGQNGSIDLSDLGGKVMAQTSFASMKVNNAGAASLKNQNGRIEAVHIHGPLDAETSFAPLIAKDIEGPLKARNQNGRIDVAHVKGDVDLKTSFAELQAENVEGEATLANQNGRVQARNIAGSVKAATSFANLEVESAGRDLNCRNQNGSIHLRATSTELSRIDAETAFASLEVRLPAGLKPAIQANTSFGNIVSDFPVVLTPKGQDAFSEGDKQSPRVTLHNQNGRIRIQSDKSVAER